MDNIYECIYSFLKKFQNRKKNKDEVYNKNERTLRSLTPTQFIDMVESVSDSIETNSSNESCVNTSVVRELQDIWQAILDLQNMNKQNSNELISSKDKSIYNISITIGTSDKEIWIYSPTDFESNTLITEIRLNGSTYIHITVLSGTYLDPIFEWDFNNSSICIENIHNILIQILSYEYPPDLSNIIET
jgi:hypothetical protein